MCGRYALHASPEVVALQFGLGRAPEFAARYNICPGGDVLVVQLDRERRRAARLRRWGFGNRLANARGETVAERPAFRDALRRWRCVVPASGFYEWARAGARRQPWYVHPAGEPLFALAGICASWDGVRSVSLLTTAPNVLVAPIHERMPVILGPDDYAAWLDPGLQDGAELIRLLRPYPAERMRAHRVGMRVNKPENDDPSLIAEWHEAAAQRDFF